MACPPSFLPDRAKPMAVADPGRATGRENASYGAGTGGEGGSIDAIAYIRDVYSKSGPGIHASYRRSSLCPKRREKPDTFPWSGHPRSGLQLLFLNRTKRIHDDGRGVRRVAEIRKEFVRRNSRV